MIIFVSACVAKGRHIIFCRALCLVFLGYPKFAHDVHIHYEEKKGEE